MNFSFIALSVYPIILMSQMWVFCKAASIESVELDIFTFV